MLAFISWIFFLLQWAPGWLSLQHSWIISLCIEWAAVPLIAHQGQGWKTITGALTHDLHTLDLVLSWFSKGRGNSLLSPSQAWFPSSTMVVRGAGGHHGQCPGGPQWQWGTAGQVESASTDSAVERSAPPKGVWFKTAQCRVMAALEDPGVLSIPAQELLLWGLPRSLPILVGQADSCATALWLLTALICTLSSIHSYSWVRKISECKDYMERVSLKKKKQKLFELSLCWGQAVVSFKKMFSLCVWTVLQIYFPSPSWMKVAGISTKYILRSQAFNTSSFQSECWNDQ